MQEPAAFVYYQRIMSWNRQRVVEEVRPESAKETSGFTFDDAVLRPAPAEGKPPQPLHLDASDVRPGSREGAARPGRARHSRRRSPKPASPAFTSAEPLADDRFSARGLSLALGFFGAALLLVALLFFGLQRENLGSDPLAQWRSAAPLAPDVRPEPAAPQAAPQTAPPAEPTAARSVRRIKVPAVPGPLAIPRTAPLPPATAPRGEPAQEAETAPERTAAVEAPDAPQLADGETEALFTLAEEYRQMGDAERAEQLLRRLLQEGRQPGRAALALGDILLARERFAEAREMFRRSKELFDEEKRGHAARE